MSIAVEQVPRVCLRCRRVFPGSLEDHFCSRAHEEEFFAYGEMEHTPGWEPPVAREKPARVRKPRLAREPKPRKPRREPRLIPCARCGKLFKPKDRESKYCSRECYATGVERVCRQCGKPFRAARSDVARGAGLYCSRECRHKAKSVDLICRVCGREFNVPKSRLAREGFPEPCCSRRCSNRARSQEAGS